MRTIQRTRSAVLSLFLLGLTAAACPAPGSTESGDGPHYSISFSP